MGPTTCHQCPLVKRFQLLNTALILKMGQGHWCRCRPHHIGLLHKSVLAVSWRSRVQGKKIMSAVIGLESVILEPTQKQQRVVYIDASLSSSFSLVMSLIILVVTVLFAGAAVIVIFVAHHRESCAFCDFLFKRYTS